MMKSKEVVDGRMVVLDTIPVNLTSSYSPLNSTYLPPYPQEFPDHFNEIKDIPNST